MYRRAMALSYDVFMCAFLYIALVIVCLVLPACFIDLPVYAVEISRYSALALSLIMPLIYFVGFNHFRGITPGKKLFGIKVISLNADKVSRSLLRSFLKALCLLLLSYIYALIAIWRKDGRSIADFISRTAVVDAGTLSPLPVPSIPKRLLFSVLAIISPYMLMFIMILVPFTAVFLCDWANGFNGVHPGDMSFYKLVIFEPVEEVLNFIREHI